MKKLLYSACANAAELAAISAIGIVEGIRGGDSARFDAGLGGITYAGVLFVGCLLYHLQASTRDNKQSNLEKNLQQ